MRTHAYGYNEIEVNLASYNYYTIEKNVISKYVNHIAYKKYEQCTWNEIDTFSLVLNVFPENLNYCNILCKVINLWYGIFILVLTFNNLPIIYMYQWPSPQLILPWIRTIATFQVQGHLHKSRYFTNASFWQLDWPIEIHRCSY